MRIDVCARKCVHVCMEAIAPPFKLHGSEDHFRLRHFRQASIVRRAAAAASKSQLAVGGPTEQTGLSMVHPPLPIAHGPWLMAHGPWLMAHGPWPMAHMTHGLYGPWCMAYMAHGPWEIADGLWPNGLLECSLSSMADYRWPLASWP